MFDIANVPSEGAKTSLKVYDVSGRLIKTLVDRRMGPGRYEAVWNGTNNSGAPIASGVYFYRLKVGNYTKTKKMVLLR